MPRISLVLGLALACAHPEYAPPLEKIDEEAVYRFENRSDAGMPGNPDETFIYLTLSGGGTRGAALAYGAMRGLEATQLAGDGGRTLLDEVDIISSVSGGSFASTYYGVNGKEAFFEDFPEAVLHRKIQRGLLLGCSRHGTGGGCRRGGTAEAISPTRTTTPRFSRERASQIYRRGGPSVS